MALRLINRGSESTAPPGRQALLSRAELLSLGGLRAARAGCPAGMCVLLSKKVSRKKAATSRNAYRTPKRVVASPTTGASTAPRE